MTFAYLHGEQYILPILLLFAAVFIGIPAIIGVLFYRWRNRKAASTRNQGPPSRG